MDAITESPGRYRPVSRKYDTIDRRYKFFETIRAHRMQTCYPLIQLGRSSYSSARHKTTNLKSQASIESEMDISQFTADSDSKKVTINDLSNDILLTIFAYCHPIDLIHSFSLVCHRWNYLANHSAFFTEVRVLVNDISLKYGSVKKFFHRISQYLRKLCIDCSVPLPSAEVNALFDICFPNVIHLDIGSFKEMNIALLKKLSYCFPNVEILHMDAVERCSVYDDECEEEWNEVLEMLFKNENIFPKMRNFFMGDVSQYCVKADEKLWACKRPLNLLHVNNGAIKLNFVGIGTSSWKSTLTELHLGYYIENEDFQYIADLHNLKVFSLGICIYVPDEFIAPLKNLYNLEELRINCGGEDCDLTNDGMIALFTLPCKHPEKSFPYKLKHLELADFHACRTNLLETINRNCPELRSLGLPYNKYMDDAAVPFIISHFKHLVHLNLSRLGDCYKNEDWNNLDDDDLPNLFFLKLHGNQVNIETFQSLNVKRPKLLISTKWNYLINWTETDNGYIFHDTFDGDIRAIENDLHQIDGFCDVRITSPSFIYNRRHGSVARTSSFRSYPFAFKEKEPFEISIHDHSV